MVVTVAALKCGNDILHTLSNIFYQLLFRNYSPIYD